MNQIPGSTRNQGLGNEDVHICGSCGTQFNDIDAFVVHKRQGCGVLTNQSVIQNLNNHSSQHQQMQEDAISNKHRTDGVQSQNHDAMYDGNGGIPIQEDKNGSVAQSAIHQEIQRLALESSDMSDPGIGHESHEHPVIISTRQDNNQEIQHSNIGNSILSQAVTASMIGQTMNTKISQMQTSQTTLSESVIGQAMSEQASRLTSVQASGSHGSTALSGLLLGDEKERSPSKQLSSMRISPTKEGLRKKKDALSKQYSCEYQNCNFTSNYAKDLDRHFRIHTGEKPFQCQECKKSFSRSDKLKVHMRGHTGDKPYKCTYCTYASVDNSSLKKHLRIHTNERPYKCQICPYASRNSSQLVVHLRTHTGDTPFVCTICDAKFKINSDLKRHMRLHTGEKPFKCQYCDYRCAIKGNLKTHFRINHCTENLIKCTECDFQTASRRFLREHVKMHHREEEKIQCPKCNYTCASKGSLRMHLRVHSTEKPYKCSFCNYTSKQSGNVKMHIHRKHKDRQSGKRAGKGPVIVKMEQDFDLKRNFKREKIKPVCKKAYPCHLCEDAFVREDSLRSHVKQHQERELEQARRLKSTALAVLQLQHPVTMASGQQGHGQEARSQEVTRTEVDIHEAPESSDNVKSLESNQRVENVNMQAQQVQHSAIVDQAAHNLLAIMQNNQNMALEENNLNEAINAARVRHIQTSMSRNAGKTTDDVNQEQRKMDIPETLSSNVKSEFEQQRYLNMPQATSHQNQGVVVQQIPGTGPLNALPQGESATNHQMAQIENYLKNSVRPVDHQQGLMETMPGVSTGTQGYQAHKPSGVRQNPMVGGQGNAFYMASNPVIQQMPKGQLLLQTAQGQTVLINPNQVVAQSKHVYPVSTNTNAKVNARQNQGEDIEKQSSNSDRLCGNQNVSMVVDSSPFKLVKVNPGSEHLYSGGQDIQGAKIYPNPSQYQMDRPHYQQQRDVLVSNTGANSMSSQPVIQPVQQAPMVEGVNNTGTPSAVVSMANQIQFLIPASMLSNLGNIAVAPTHPMIVQVAANGSLERGNMAQTVTTDSLQMLQNTGTSQHLGNFSLADLQSQRMTVDASAGKDLHSQRRQIRDT